MITEYELTDYEWEPYVKRYLLLILFPYVLTLLVKVISKVWLLLKMTETLFVT